MGGNAMCAQVQVTLLGILVDGGLITILIIDGAATGAWSKAVTNYYRVEPRCDAAALAVPEL